MELNEQQEPQTGETRVRLDCSYHGADFSGWQIQPEAPSVQGALMKAFEELCPNQPRVIGAGRTDAGVHALQQVAHVDLIDYESREPETWLNALNSLTPERLWIKSLQPVAPDFHARFSPHTKTYQYFFEWSPYPDPFFIDRHYHLRSRSLDLEAIKAFLEHLQGTHDFKNYCSAQNTTETTLRTIVSSQLHQINDKTWCMEFKGKGFLQHMIRIIAGTALHIGLKKIKWQTALDALEKDDMRKALGPTLPAHGLCLKSIEY